MPTNPRIPERFKETNLEENDFDIMLYLIYNYRIDDKEEIKRDIMKGIISKKSGEILIKNFSKINKIPYEIIEKYARKMIDGVDIYKQVMSLIKIYN